jgi:DNA processing protein
VDLLNGIDSFAHIGALKGEKSTIAVIGSGFDYIYPKENAWLYKKIAREGLIISEYVPGTLPLASNFPARNRIISGLSDGIVVIEAKEKSGTMITVDFALEQGKDIFAVPGSIYSLNSKGTNSLIKQGAKVVCDISDILEEYNL